MPSRARTLKHTRYASEQAFLLRRDLKFESGLLQQRVLGGGFGNVACYLLLLAMLMVRPHGMFGRRKPERV
jgi:branched-subunit amino acid ABC-type transport system permease component